MDEGEKLSEIKNFLTHYFYLSEWTRVVKEPLIDDTGSFEPDLVLEDGDRRYFIEIAPRSGLNKLSQISLFRELLKSHNSDRYNDSFVLLYKTIPKKIEEAAERIGVTIVRAPFDMKLSGYDKSGMPTKIKLTTKRSWDVIYYLIKHGPASMYQISKESGVSYGWVHKVAMSLVDTGIASKERDLVRIVDQNKLFNGMAWERPFEFMKIDEIIVDYETPHIAAREISGNLKAHNVKFAFNGQTAGGLYTGKVIRHDTAYLYLEISSLESFKDTFSSREGKGIKIKIYRPDRDVFSRSRDLESVTITSPEQTLLDLACSGYGNMELTKAMADYHEAK